MTEECSREYIAKLDSRDPLRSARAHFALPEGMIYLDGNSLGPMLKSTPDRMTAHLVDEWGRDLITSWNKHDWFHAPYRIGDKIAQLIGAEAGEVVVTDNVSVNLYKLILCALNKSPGRRKIVAESGNFPTDVYILKGVLEAHKAAYDLVLFEDRDTVLSLIDDDTALVMLTDVHYKSGHRLDMAEVTAKAHSHGALVIWDLCHSAGVLETTLNTIGADFAVGCTYKYMNGGPGAPGFVFVAGRHHDNLNQPIQGWWGHQAPFDFSDQYVPKAGIGQILSGTQGIPSMICMEHAVDFLLKYSIQELSEKSSIMGDLFIRLVRNQCGEFGFEVASPEDRNRRGAQVALRHAGDGYAIVQALIKRGVVGDFRAPDILRFGFSPLFLRYADIQKAVLELREVMLSAEWRSDEFQRRGAVT